MHSHIIGNTLPVLELALNQGEGLVAETGQLSWMTGGIELRTTTNTAGTTGFLGAIGRALSGGGLFMTEYTAPYAPGTVAFAAKIPGKIIEIQVQPHQGFLIHKHGFVCGTAGVQLGTGFQQSLGAGIFGGNGFLLQRLSGYCTAWVELGGEVIERRLAPGEQIRVHPGHVGMFEESVNFGITTLRGISNIFFGGDGLFLAELTGAGARLAANPHLAQPGPCAGALYGRRGNRWKPVRSWGWRGRCLKASFQGRKERPSFLKKRSKKLLNLAADVVFQSPARALASTNKGFLVLFFHLIFTPPRVPPSRNSPAAMGRETCLA